MRLVRNSPAGNVTDVDRRDVVGGTRMAAADAKKQVSRLTVAFVHQSTDRASTRSIPGIAVEVQDAREFALVTDELTQLGEGPTVQSSPLLSSNRDSPAYAGQFFQGDPARGALSRSHDALTDDVIHMSGEAGLLAPPLFEESSCRLGALLLESLPESAVPVPQTVDLAAAVDVTIGVSGDVDDPEVNAEEVINVLRLRRLHVAAGYQVELAAHEREAALPLAESEEFPLARPADEGDALTASEGQDGDFPLVKMPTEGAVVVVNSPVLAEGALAPPVEFVGVGDLGDQSHREVGRQREPFSDGIVSQSMKAVLSEGAVFPGLAACPVAGRVHPLYDLAQSSGLFGCRQQFGLGRDYHNCKYSTSANNCKGGRLPYRKVGQSEA